MKSSVQASALHNVASALNNPIEKRISTLASQYMDMFDPEKLEASLLGKRAAPSSDKLFSEELQKKIKTPIPSRDVKPQVNVPNLASLLFQPNYMLNLSLSSLLGQPNPELERLQQIQNLNLLLNMKQQQDILQAAFNPSLLLNNSLELNKVDGKAKAVINKGAVKEEYVETQPQHTSPSAETHKASTTDAKSDLHVTSETSSIGSLDKRDNEMSDENEPTLVEYTKAFPEWDLATIFNFLNSGKSKEAFEKEKKFRIERKLKKAKLPSKIKDKAGTSKDKIIKSKKSTKEIESNPALLALQRLQEALISEKI